MQGIWFDARVEKLINDFAATLVLTKSTVSGGPEPFVLLPHARRAIVNLLCWKRADGTRVYRRGYWSMARKQAKTQNVAFLGLFELVFTPEMSPEIYSAATDTEQASHIYTAARDMIRGTEWDAENGGPLKVVEYKKTILNLDNGGLFKALSAEGKSKHGSNPSTVLFDELHVWGPEHQELFDALTTGSSTRRQPLQLSITTAGSEPESICGREYEYAKKVLDGTIKDPTYFAMVHEIPKDADWSDESLWGLSMPAIDHFPGQRQFIREECERAKQSPAKQNSFRRLYCNQWTGAEEQWIPVKDWDACATKIDWESLRGVPCYAGLDLSSTRDLTALSVWWPLDDGTFVFRSWCFLPKHKITERAVKDGVPYDVWAEKSYLELTPGDQVDEDAVLARVRAVCSEFDVRSLAFDRWGSKFLAPKIDFVPLEPFGQGYADMSDPAKAFEKAVFAGKLKHDGNPLVRWCLDNTAAASDPAGNIKLVKPDLKKSRKRIDPIVAGVMACGEHRRTIEPLAEVFF